MGQTVDLYQKVKNEIGSCTYCGRDTSLNKDHKHCDACGAELPKLSRTIFLEILEYAYNTDVGHYCGSTPFVYGFPIAGFK